MRTVREYGTHIPRPGHFLVAISRQFTGTGLVRGPALIVERGAFEIRSGFVRESFGMPAFLPPASLHACRYGSPHCRTGCVRDTLEILLGFVRDSFGMPAFLPASLQVVRYCTALHVDTGALIVGRGAFGICSRFVWDSFVNRSGFVRDACLPACLPACYSTVAACMQAGSRYSYQYGTSYHKYSYISRTRGRSYLGHTVLSVRRCGRDAAIPPTKFVRP